MPDEVYAGRVGRPSAELLTIIPGGEGTPIPDVPPSLHDGEAWHRLWTIGRGWLSNEAHYDLMRLLCEAIENRDRLARRMRREAVMIPGSTGQQVVHPGFKQLDASEAKIARLLDQAGFSPRRQRTAAAQGGESRLDDLRARARQ